MFEERFATLRPLVMFLYSTVYCRSLSAQPGNLPGCAVCTGRLSLYFPKIKFSMLSGLQWILWILIKMSISNEAGFSLYLIKPDRKECQSLTWLIKTLYNFVHKLCNSILILYPGRRMDQGGTSVYQFAQLQYFLLWPTLGWGKSFPTKLLYAPSTI